MKKHVWFTILILITFILGSMTAAEAEIIPPYGEGQIGLQAVVLCESLTVRREPSTDSAAVMTLKYGSLFAVQKQQNGWADCFISDDVDAGQTGWVRSDYIAVDPAWYRTEAATPVYAWNDTSAPKVALLDAGHSLVVVEHNPDVIRSADWLIDLGPDAGSRGGEVVFAGTPEDMIAHGNSFTAQYLRR